jgi:hypothetical protein
MRRCWNQNNAMLRSKRTSRPHGPWRSSRRALQARLAGIAIAESPARIGRTLVDVLK